MARAAAACLAVALVALALAARLPRAAGQIRDQAPKVFLDRLKLPPGFGVELFTEGVTLVGVRDFVVSGNSKPGGPIIVSGLPAACAAPSLPPAPRARSGC